MKLSFGDPMIGLLRVALCGVLFSFSLLAAPASLDPILIQQNGGSWTLFQRGDEFLHWFVERDSGVPVNFNQSTQKWEVLQSSGNLTLTSTGNALSSGMNWNAYSPLNFPIKDLRTLKAQKINSVKSKKLSSSVGSKRQLVILAYFSDHSTGSAPDANFISGPVDGSNYQNLMNGAIDSVANYFSRVSRSQVSIQADVTPWLALPKSEASYGSDALDQSMASENLVLDALAALNHSTDSGIMMDGSIQYDWVTVIFSGQDQSRSSGNSSLLQDRVWSGWGKFSTPASLFGGNLNISHYATSAALGGADGTRAGDLGVICHEIGHLLGLPDMYEYQEAALSIGSWDLMGLGAWGLSGNAQSSNLPSPLGAWSKLILSWESATVLDVSGNSYSLSAVQTNGAIYKFPTDDVDEYFLMEYRDANAEAWVGWPTGWDGALIWHVDESVWTHPSVENALHPLIKIEEGDGNDSIGRGLFPSEVSDLWTSSTSISWEDQSRVTGSSLTYGSSYYDRSTSGNHSWFSMGNILVANHLFSFDLIGPRSRMSILDFGGGQIGWIAIQGASSYDLERKSGVNGSWAQIFSGNQLFYIDTSINGPVDYYYRVRASRYTDDLHWSNEMPYRLQMDSALFDANEGTLSLTWNLPIKLSGAGAFNLNGLQVMTEQGNLLFPLAQASTNQFSYPSLMAKDALDSYYTSSATQSTVLIHLSDAQRYEWIQRSSIDNDNLWLNVPEGIATAPLASGNIQNPAQNFTLGSAVHVLGSRDIVAPSLVDVKYTNDTAVLELFFNEPIYMSTLSLAHFTLSGANGWSTDLLNSTFTVHGNVLNLKLDTTRRIRASLIQNQNSGQLIFGLPIGQVKDFSAVAANASTDSTVQEVADSLLPFVQSFVLNNHDDTRHLALTFSEPIIFNPVAHPQGLSGGEFGFQLCNSTASALAAGGNFMGSLNGNVTLIQNPSDEFPLGSGNIYTATTGVIIELSEQEVDAVDAFYGLYTNPAPMVYGRLYNDGLFSDLTQYLDQNLVVDKKITSSTEYTPRRRARLIHPHYDPQETSLLASQESLIWKWKHQVRFQINGGWLASDKLRLEWYNTNLSSGNGLIAQNIALSGNVSKFYDVQSVLWDTTQEMDALGYQLKIKRQDGLTLYDCTPSLVEIDNTFPLVNISYISNSTPSYKVNAEELVDTTLYDLPLTPTEKDTANVIIVARYSEPVIYAPVLTLNQKGGSDNVVTMKSASGNGVFLGSGNSDSVFYFAYDVQTQDVGNFTDGEALVSITSVPDRAVGHLLVDPDLEIDDIHIVGNRSLAPVSRVIFSIDTIPPTIASLDFYVEDLSIVGENSVLRVYFSENMYILSGEPEETPFANGLPVTGVLNPANYSLQQSSGTALKVLEVTGFGAGPYYLRLQGIVESGVLTVQLNKEGLFDFNGNFVTEPSSAQVVWPGPLHNRNEVLLAPGGRTRLLLSGGFPPYHVTIDPYFSNVAIIDPKDGYSILGINPGAFTMEVIESRQQRRYVNAVVVDPTANPDLVNAQVSGGFQAFRDELDFKMVSFPFNLSNWDGASLIELLKPNAGAIGVDYSLYHYAEGGQYAALLPQTTEVGPGYGFWMAFRKNKTLTVEAEGPLPEQVVGVDLHSGWNLVGNPFDDVLLASNIYISTGGYRYSVKNLAQSETEHELWTIDITSPSYRSATSLQPFQGAWLYVNNSEGTELVYYRGVEDPSYPIDYEPLPQNKPLSVGKRAPALAPPPPPGTFEGGSSLGFSSASGGGGGCLLQ